MPGVFISYQRSSAAMAKRVAAQLRAEGREVWLDVDLPPNRSYSEVIREHLDSANAVLVLWTAEAAASEWVRAEADTARQQRKLVQASFDGAPLPLPFNQIQYANLKGWRRGQPSSEWRKITDAIDQLTATGAAGPAKADEPAARAAPATGGRRGLGLIALAVAVVALLAGGAWLLRGYLPSTAAKPAQVRVAIVPFQVESQAPSTKYFADGLAAQVESALNNNQLQVISASDTASLGGADRDAKIAQLGVRLLFDGAVQDDGKTTAVDVHLNDTANHVILWSGHFEGPSNQPDPLQAHIDAVIVGVLNCSGQALQPQGGLSDPQVLILYLVACDRFAQQGEANAQMTDQMVSALRQVTQRAPQFGPAHSALAKFLAYSIPVVPPAQAAANRAEASTEAQKALALNPKDADAYVALEMLEPASNWAQREALLQKGLAGDPDWPHANGFMGRVLAEVGRTTEALAYSRKAAAADPLGESWAADSAALLAGAGQRQEADADAAQLAKSWPKSLGDQFFRMQVFESDGDWDGLLAFLNDPAVVADFPKALIDSVRLFATAAKSRAPDDLAKARANLLEMSKVSPLSLTQSIAQLAALGYEDDAFKLAEGYQPGLSLSGADTTFLFTTQTAPLRRDPRFMQLAARIGLVKYWRTAGVWPDFCHDPALPYRCS